MVLYYALGGGLGHLTRARRVLAALGCEEEAVLLTASRFARDPRVTGGLPVLPVPMRLDHDRDAFRRWITDCLHDLRPEQLLVDSFPGGILGELCGIPLPPARYVARLLQWERYARRLDGPLPRFELTYLLEPVRHELAGPVEPLELPVPHAGSALVDEPHWLVVHSGPDAELVALLRYADDLRAGDLGDAQIIIVSPQAPSWLPRCAHWRDVYPIAPFLGHAERIVTAAGFNLMHETLQLGERHHFVPFPRALDAQFERAAARRRTTPVVPV